VPLQSGPIACKIQGSIAQREPSLQTHKWCSTGIYVLEAALPRQSQLNSKLCSNQIDAQRCRQGRRGEVRSLQCVLSNTNCLSQLFKSHAAHQKQCRWSNFFNSARSELRGLEYMVLVQATFKNALCLEQLHVGCPRQPSFVQHFEVGKLQEIEVFCNGAARDA
jgi:hypothetical protein